MGRTIFIVDDDETQLALAEKTIQTKLGYRTITARGGREAIERFMLRIQPRPSLMLLDLMMPEVSGLDVVRTIRRTDKQIPIIVMSAFGGLRQAVAAVDAGANDFLMKPMSLERLKLTIEHQLQCARLSEEINRLNRFHSGHLRMEDVIGQDERLLAAKSMAQRAAESSIPIMVHGERGTGKELMARAIHGLGCRSEAPFVVFHGAHHSSDALKALLSGQETAGMQAVGMGTLYLDGPQHLDPEGQSVLLDTLKATHASGQQGTFRGRLIVGCDEHLVHAVQRGEMCDRLFAAVGGYPIYLPPLRERRGDIIGLAEHFIAAYSAQERPHVQQLSIEAKQLLMAYDWPGNVSELRQQVQRAVLACDGPQIQPGHFSSLIERAGPDLIQHVAWMQQPEALRSGAISLMRDDGNIKPMQDMESELIRYAIHHYGGRMSEVARRLGIGRSTLYRKLQDYNIQNVA